MKDVTKKLKITDKNCLDREQYGKKWKEIKVIVEKKKNGRVLRGRRKGSKGKQKWLEDSGLREKWKWERKSNDIRVVLTGRFVKKKN